MSDGATQRENGAFMPVAPLETRPNARGFYRHLRIECGFERDDARAVVAWCYGFSTPRGSITFHPSGCEPNWMQEALAKDERAKLETEYSELREGEGE